MVMAEKIKIALLIIYSFLIIGGIITDFGRLIFR